MKHVSIQDFLTEEEIAKARELWYALKDTGTFAKTLDATIIAPQMKRINQALGQENDSRYLAYAVEYVFRQADAATPPDPSEWAEDRCQMCGRLIGAGLRAWHVGLCDECAAAPKH